jgi:hypothetical protein
MKSLLFCLLSLADLALTCWLLGNSGGQAYEANPLARWWLSRHGWVGLACFKLTCVLTVLGLASLISRYRPRAGGRVLTFGCAALAAVVLYSAALCLGADASPERLQAEESRRLDEEFHKAEAYHALLDRLVEDVLAGRLTLREAAQLAAESERGRDPTWLECLARVYPGRSGPECLAANVIHHAVISRAKEPEVGVRLEAEFYRTFGARAPALPQVQLERAAVTWSGPPRWRRGGERTGWRQRGRMAQAGRPD